jgi:amidase
LLAPEVLEAQRAPRARVEAALGRAAPVEVVLDSFEAMYWSFRYLQGRERGAPTAR